MESTTTLIGVLGASLYAQKAISSRATTNVMDGVEKVLGRPEIFGMIVLLQGLLGGRGFVDPPASVVALFESPIARVGILTFIAYTATQEIESALLTVLTFATVVQLLRSPEEREAHPYLV